MNQLEEQLSRIVEKSIDLAEKTGQFVIDQAPELLQEFYKWHIVSDIFFIIISIIIFIIGQKLYLIWAEKVPKDYEPNWDEIIIKGMVVEYGSYYISRFSFGFIGLVIFFIYLYDLVFILTAPKLYLIEYFIK